MDNELNAAAKWWANILRAGEHPRSNLGAPELEPYFAFTQKAPHFSDEQIDAFEKALRTVLEKAYVTQEIRQRYDEKYSYGQGFGVDYEPGQLLELAAEQAGIDLTRCLPAKTIMWIRPKTVKVKRGYGAPIMYIYGSISDDPSNEK
jgi:hypothetical protein